jgi:putative ATP-binding cassette transporter
LRSLIEGVKELKMHRQRRETFVGQLLQAAAATVRDRSRAAWTLYVVIEGWGQLLLFALLGLLLFALPGILPLDAPTRSGFVLAILFGIWPLSGFLIWLPTLAEGRVALQQVKALDEELSEAGSNDEAASRPAFGEGWQRLELAGVVHAYHREGEEGGFVLGPLDLTLSRGSVLFLVGGNGSGKTTLAKLLIGLYAPEAGDILVDGRAVTDGNREDYRQLFSVVFSDGYLFEDLLGLGQSELDGRARTYLSRLRLDHKVRIEQGRLSTVDLSQGQRKRLALLTAYLEDRPIYLFDEWAADQDPAFKEVFYTQLLAEFKARGKTVVVITHDDRYFGVADRILKLEDGKLI